MDSCPGYQVFPFPANRSRIQSTEFGRRRQRTKDWAKREEGACVSRPSQYRKHCQLGSHLGNGFVLACNFATRWVSSCLPQDLFLINHSFPFLCLQPLLLYCLLFGLEIHSSLSYFKKISSLPTPPTKKPSSISCLLFSYFCPSDVYHQPFIRVALRLHIFICSVHFCQNKTKQNLPLCIPI